MKRVIKIEANDGDSKVSMRVTFSSSASLAQSEYADVVKQLKRSLVNAIKGIAYTDFGVENTKVS